MEGQVLDLNDGPSSGELTGSFMEITSATKEEAVFFLESHQWDLDAAVSTFLDNNTSIIQPNSQTSTAAVARLLPPEESSDYSPSRSRSRSLSPAPAEPLAPRVHHASRSKGKKSGESGSRVRTLADLNQAPDGDSEDDDVNEDDEAQQYYTGGENSGMLVEAPKGLYDGDAVFDQARHRAVERPAELSRPFSSTRSFTGTGRSLAGDIVSPASQPPEMVNHSVTLWRNGFTVDDGPLRRFDDPANASFLESIRMSECPRELEPADGRTKVHLDLNRQDENYSARPTHLERKAPFPGVGRTLADSPDPDSTFQAPSSTPAQASAMGLVVDSSLPTTSIQLRLADGTRMVSRFNLHHTIRDIRGFIEASRVGSGPRNYQLQTMGFPPKQLTDQDQTIDEAGIANSVVIQKL